MKNRAACVVALLLQPTLALADASTNTASDPPQTAASVQTAPPKANRRAPPRQRFRDAKSFYTYYGAGKVAELSRYDVAILHTPQMPSAEVKRLSELGVVTIGYLTIGED